MARGVLKRTSQTVEATVETKTVRLEIDQQKQRIITGYINLKK